MFSWRDKKKYYVDTPLIWSYGYIKVKKDCLWKQITLKITIYEQQHERMYFLTCTMYIKQRLKSSCASVLSDQSLLSVWRNCILGYPKYAQWSFWSDCAKAQADQNLRWAHIQRAVFWVATHMKLGDHSGPQWDDFYKLTYIAPDMKLFSTKKFAFY